MKMTVEPDQLVSDYGGAFASMFNAGSEGVGIQVHLYQQPTYLVRDKRYPNLVQFLSFADMVWAREWFSEHKTNEVIWKFEPETE